jgi:hypothetical protein
VDELLRLGRTAVLRSVTVFVTFGTIVTFCIAARAQTATYHLHKEASAINTSFDQLKTSGPDAAITALTTVLTNKAAGDYLIKEFETQTGVPNASGVIQSGSNFSFSLYMRKTANVTGVTVKPEAKLKLNTATGTNLCSAIGSTALTTTVTLMNFSCSTTANISMATSDRFYLWVGVNISASSSSAYSGELDIEGTANGNFDSHITVTLPIGPPTISNITPSGAAIGTAVVITGTSFGSAQGSSTVAFNGIASTPSAWSPTSITTQVPIGATSGPVVVTVNGQSSVGTTFTVLPGIAGLSPNSGVSDSSITITGTNFGAAQGGVTFNGTTGAITSWSDKAIVVKVPVGATTGNVTVTTAAGAQSAGASFTVFNPGTGVMITSLSSIEGVPGSSLTITGVNFGAAPGTVTFNGTAATVTSWSTGSIVATVPTGASTGNVVVTVNGQSSNGLRFIVTNAAGLAVDQIVSGHAALPPPLSTTSGNELLLAFVGSGTGSTAGNSFTVSGLTWTLVKRTNTQKGTAEIWRAFAPFILNNFTAPPGTSFPAHASVTLVSYLGVDISGTNGSGAMGATGTNNSSSGAPSVTLTSTRSNSFVFGVGDDPSGAIARTLGTNQTMIDQFLDGTADTLWVQRVTGSIANSGTSVALNDTAPTNHPYNFSSVEILPSPAAIITSLSPSSGPVGTSLTINGSNFGATQGSSTVTFGGIAATATWSSASIVATVPNGVSLGPVPVVVTTTNGASNPVTFTVVAPLSIGAAVSSAIPPTNNWYRSDATITYQCSGGVAPLQCPTSQTVSNEGFDQQITGTVTDATGQTKSVTTHLNIDKTAPTITATVTPAPVNGIVTIPSNGSVIVSFNCADALSGVAICPSAISVATPGASQAFSGTAIDAAGNSSTPANITLNVQAAPPAISASLSSQPNTNGWYNNNVTINYQCTGGVPPLQCPSPQTVSSEGSNQPITATVTDAVGQTASASNHLSIDKTAPTIVATVTPAPVNGIVTIPTGGAANISFACSDALSGVALCPTNLSVTTAGANQSFSGSATDNAGNSALANVTLNAQAAPLTINANLTPAANAAGWNNSDVTVTFQGAGGVPPLQIPPPQVVSTDGPNQSITGSITDAAGQSVTTSVQVSLDKTPPTIAASVSPQPNANSWITNVVPIVTFTCADTTSGIANCPAPQVITTDGAGQTISGAATDVAGNVSSTSLVLNVEFAAPTIHASSSPPPNAQGWNNSDVIVSFECAGGVSGGLQCPSPKTITTEGGGQVISGTVTDNAGNTAADLIKVNLDKTPPTLKIVSPSSGTTVSFGNLTLSGTAEDAVSGAASVTCDGIPASLGTSQPVFTCPVTLNPGANSVTIQAVDIAGNTNTVSEGISFVPGPAITITAPSSLSLFGTNPVSITGTIDDPQAAIACNGINGTVNGNTFTISGINLREAKNLLTVTATNVAGGTSTATIVVYLDTTPPQIHVDSPNDGATVNTAQTSVMGSVNDLVGGTVNGDQVSVTVNGVQATVENRSFVAQNVMLVPGTNTIIAIATDRAGNISQHQVHITLVDVKAVQHLVIISGNNQTAPIRAPLPQRLVVQAVDGSGIPLPNRMLEFRVSRGDGLIVAYPQTGRDLSLQTDSNGRASVQFQVGSRSGVGINEVTVIAPGFIGDTIFSANSTVDVPAQVNIVSGEIQKGQVGAPLPEPLVAIVTDSGGNPVPNIPVIFKIEHGGGTLEGSTSVRKTTDKDGKVYAVLTLSEEEGIYNNSVSASVDGPQIPPAIFVSSGVVTGNPAATTISGIVLDNAEQPIPNATVTIKGANITPVTTDPQGKFMISNAPVGNILLYVDGRSSTRPEIFPTLSFQMITLPGIDNTLAGPIYLPPLDTDNSKMVGGDEDAILTLKGVPGVAYKVFAHSATFPNGDKTGIMTLSQVHADRVPMIPANGTAPTLVTTLQPPGVSFDPPIQVQVPNTSGLAPGQVAEVFSFRHDLEQFVTEGTARVSEDGSKISSDSGFGIRVSGWGGVSAPASPVTSACDCNLNNNCSVDSCVNGQCVHTQPKPCCDWEGPHGDENHDTYDPNTQCCIAFNPGAATQAGVHDKSPIPAGQVNDCPDRVPNVNVRRNYDGCSVPWTAVQAMTALFGQIYNPLYFSGDRNNPAGKKDTKFSDFPFVLLTTDQTQPFDFDGPGCDQHDECYQTCYDPNSDLNAAKDKCDLILLNQNVRVCHASLEVGPIEEAQCVAWAAIYYKAVGGFGQGAFSDDQAMMCQCCK